MREDLKKAVIENNLNYIKKYCDDGKDRKKFLEILTLENNLSDQLNPQKGVSALYIAVNNQHAELTNFLVQEALKDTEGKKALAACLLAKNQEGKNLLHTAAFTAKNAANINTICTVAKQLANEGFTKLKDYLSIPEEMFGSTPLHIAARRTNLENYIALANAGADEKLKSNPNPPNNDGFIPVELAKYQPPEESIPFVFALIKQSNAVKSYFKQRHGQIETLSDDLLKSIIQIDLDAGLTDSAPAQLSAYNECMRLLREVAKTEEEYNAILSNIALINLAIITEKDLQEARQKKLSGSLQALSSALKKATDIDNQDQAAKNAFLRAEIFRTLKGLPNTNKEAFEQYTRLIQNYPQLAVEGYGQIELTEEDRGFVFLFARRYLIAMAKSKMENLQKNPSKIVFPNLLKRGVDQSAIDALQNFMDNINNFDTVKQLYGLVETLKGSSLQETNKNMVIALGKIDTKRSPGLNL